MMLRLKQFPLRNKTTTAGINLSTQNPEIGSYTPAELLSDISAELMKGYWKSLYVEFDGVLLFSDDIGDRTDLYIESPKAALGGPLFGDTTIYCLRVSADDVEFPS